MNQHEYQLKYKENGMRKAYLERTKEHRCKQMKDYRIKNKEKLDQKRRIKENGLKALRILKPLRNINIYNTGLNHPATKYINALFVTAIIMQKDYVVFITKIEKVEKHI